MSIELWRKCPSFKLSEAALLLAGHDPDRFSDADLLARPPEGFKAIYGAMLSDATLVTDPYAESEEEPGAYCTLYRLMTDKPSAATTLSDQDGFTVRVERLVLDAWAEQMGFGLGLLDGAAKSTPAAAKGLHPRESNSLHRIIGALKQIILDGQKSEFPSQTDLVAYLTDKYRGFEGVSKPKLEQVFAQSNRLLEEP